MKKEVYHICSINLFLFLLIDAALLAIPTFTVPALMQSLSGGDITFILGDIAALYLVIHLTAHLFIDKMVLTENSLVIKEAGVTLFFKVSSADVPLAEIKTVYFGRSAYLRGKLAGNRPGMNELKRHLEGLFKGRSKKAGENLASDRFVLMLESAGGKCSAFGTKPYSKKQMVRFLDRLKSLGISVCVEEGIF